MRQSETSCPYLLISPKETIEWRELIPRVVGIAEYRKDNGAKATLKLRLVEHPGKLLGDGLRRQLERAASERPEDNAVVSVRKRNTENGSDWRW